MNATLIHVFSYSILLAGIIGAIRLKWLDRSFLPFLILIWIGCFNEFLSEFLIARKMHTIINSNIYVLIEGLCITWLFYLQRLFKNASFFLHAILSSLILVWVIEITLIRSIHDVFIYYRIFYSFCIVFMSIQQINTLLTSSRTSIHTNALFLICIGFIIYFTYKILVNSFWLYGLKRSQDFVMGIYAIMIYINLFCNLIYALATLWIPRKQPSLLP
jgi:hypothetical protein